MSGDERSIDMFASEFNSVSGQTGALLIDDSNSMVKDKANKSRKRPPGTTQHAQRHTVDFSQSGFDLVDRIYDPTPKNRNLSLNEDIEVEIDDDVSVNTENCENYRQKYIQSIEESKELRGEVTRLSDKLNNVRRLQEMGMMSSFPTTMSQTEATPKM